MLGIIFGAYECSPRGDTNAILSAQMVSPHKSGENDGVAGKVKPRTELTQYCKQMDVKELLNFTMKNHKNLLAIRDKLSVALESATEPGRLVLASFEGFYPPDSNTQKEDKNDAVLQGMRQSCLILMEAMATFFGKG